VRISAFDFSSPLPKTANDPDVTVPRLGGSPQALELGGKSAPVVCPSANLDAAVEGALHSTIFNKGEV